ncbi:MAG TPA: hypothetical protein VG265_12545 [Gaiellaceae bacterium]|jgi:hypothetical protein|nr:hypothetical protein [Gaiellaceae bacterium]
MRTPGAILVGAGLALALAAGAQANKTKIDKADQAASVSALVKVGDLPKPFTWTGGKVVTGGGGSGFSCKNFKPKSSDLVTTGAAGTTFTAQGVQLSENAERLKTATMVTNDVKRTFVGALVPCLAQTLAAGAPGMTVQKAAPVTFPRDAKYTAAIRILFTIKPKGKTAEHGAFDYIALGAGRTEISITFTAIFGSLKQQTGALNGMAAIDENMAKLIAKRSLTAAKAG